MLMMVLERNSRVFNRIRGSSSGACSFSVSIPGEDDDDDDAVGTELLPTVATVVAPLLFPLVLELVEFVAVAVVEAAVVVVAVAIVAVVAPVLL